MAAGLDDCAAGTVEYDASSNAGLLRQPLQLLLESFVALGLAFLPNKSALLDERVVLKATDRRRVDHG